MSTIDNEALAWVRQAAERPLRGAERAAFDAWYGADIRHQGAYLRAQAVDYAMSQATVRHALPPTREQLEGPATDEVLVPPAPRRQFLRYGAMAAGVALVAGAALLLQPPANQVLTTARSELRKVPLSDHPVATINGDTRLEVDMSGKARQLALTRGEAWFEVAKDKRKPFIVAAGEVRARAVGTAFGVRRYANGAEVLVTEGIVEVWSNEGSAQMRVLGAGERAFVADRAASIAVERQPREIERKLAWRSGQLVFRNQKLSEAVADFSRYSSKPIIIVDQGLGDKTFVGQYPIGAAEVFAKDVGAYLGVPVRITAQAILIGAAKG
jgi:transmembrane sensor